MLCCFAISGIAIAESRSTNSFDPATSNAVAAEAVMRGANDHTVRSAADSGTLETSMVNTVSSSGTIATDGPAILWLVALALMAVVWLGRRNDGGV